VPYAVLADIEDLYGSDYLVTSADRLSDGTADATAVTAALLYASSHMDTFIGRVYNLPLGTPLPDVLTKIAIDLAVYDLSAEAGPVSKEKKRRHEAANKWLKLVSEGKVSLGVATEPTNSGGGFSLLKSGQAAMTVDDRLMTRKKMEGIL